MGEIIDLTERVRDIAPDVSPPNGGGSDDYLETLGEFCRDLVKKGAPGSLDYERAGARLEELGIFTALEAAGRRSEFKVVE